MKDLAVKKTGKWTVVRKPRPAGMDEWTNVDHDAGGGKVSDDTLTAPAEIRWAAGPVLAVYTGSPVGTVSAGGRNFYLVNRGEIPLAFHHRRVCPEPKVLESRGGGKKRKLDPQKTQRKKTQKKTQKTANKRKKNASSVIFPFKEGVHHY